MKGPVKFNSRMPCSIRRVGDLGLFSLVPLHFCPILSHTLNQPQPGHSRAYPQSWIMIMSKVLGICFTHLILTVHSIENRPERLNNLPRVIQLIKDRRKKRWLKWIEEEKICLDLHRTAVPEYLYFAKDQRQFSSLRLKWENTNLHLVSPFLRGRMAALI